MCSGTPDAVGLTAALDLGAPGLNWPVGMAQAFGGHNQILQLHHHNPSQIGGLTDIESGVRLKMTTERPRNVITGLTVGLHPYGEMAIPPNVSNVTMQVDCALNITGKVQVVAYAPRAHGLGRKILTQILRPHHHNPTTLLRVGDVGDVEHYDFNSQRIWQYNSTEYQTLLPGDTVRVLCNYDSRSRAAVTSAGFGSEDEMCMTFLFVYPQEHVSDTNCHVSKAQDVSLGQLRYVR